MKSLIIAFALFAFWLRALCFALFQTESLLSPTAMAIVAALFTVVAGFIVTIGMKLSDASNSRIKGALGALMGAYGIITPVLSNLPRKYGVVIAVVGLVLTMTSERINGGVTDQAKRIDAANNAGTAK